MSVHLEHFKLMRFYCIAVIYTCKFVLVNKVRSTPNLCLLTTVVIINSVLIVCFYVTVQYVHEVSVLFSYLKATKCRIFVLRVFDQKSFAIASFGLKVKVYY
jgi:hypothetical protein